MDQDQLKSLFEYTKFHVGVYITLTGILLTSLLKVNELTSRGLKRILAFTIMLYTLAGAAGGAILSNIPEYETYAKYSSEQLSIFGISTFNYKIWGHVEHGAFWAGSLLLIVGIVWVSDALRSESSPESID